MIITISRECGCGGREVGRRLAKKLGIGFYDKEAIAELAKEKGIDTNMSEFENSGTESQIHAFYMNLSGKGEENKALLRGIINEIASKGSCVIVGRCADHILRDGEDVTTVFIHADLESKIARVMERNHMGADEARQLLAKVDRKRRAYFESCTGQRWGEANSYNLCLDSAYLGLNGCVDIIEEFLNKRLKVKKCFD